MSERDMIVETIAAHRGRQVAPTWPPTARCTCGWTTSGLYVDRRDAHEQHLADQIAAAISEARTVRSVADLDALPEGTIIVDTPPDGAIPIGWTRFIGRWEGPAVVGPNLPALIAYRPDEDGAL